MSSFHRWENWGLERWSNLPTGTQLASGRARIWARWVGFSQGGPQVSSSSSIAWKRPDVTIPGLPHTYWIGNSRVGQTPVLTSPPGNPDAHCLSLLGLLGPKCHRLNGSHRRLFLTVLEPGKSHIKVWADSGFVGSHTAIFSCALTWLRRRNQTKPPVSSYETIHPIYESSINET